jgi:hypothetical protein
MSVKKGFFGKKQILVKVANVGKKPILLHIGKNSKHY